MQTPESPNPYIIAPTINDSLEGGRKLLFANLGSLLAVTFLSFVILAPTNIINQLDNIPLWLSLTSGFYSLLVSGPIVVSATWVYLKAARRNAFSVGDMFAVFQRNYWVAVGGSFLVGLAVLIGFIFLIVPGVYLSVRLSFVSYLIIDRKMSLAESFKASWEMTQGYFWTLFGLGVISFLAILIGLLLLLVGVFFAGAWVSSAYAVLYQSIAETKGIPGVPTEQLGVPA